MNILIIQLLLCCIVIRMNNVSQYLLDSNNKRIIQEQRNVSEVQDRLPEPFIWINQYLPREDKEYYRDHPFVRQVMMFLPE